MKDYYEVLGIDRNASKDEIKRAYHRLAHKFHPDKKGGDEQKFKEVNEAYQVLSNEQKRKQYDQFGNVSGTGQGPGTAGWDFSGFRGFDDVEVGDIFETFFGQGGFRSGGGRRRGRDISIDIDVPFQEAVTALEKRLDIKSLRISLGVKELHFASPSELSSELNITPGSVSIFCMIYAKTSSLIIDEEIWQAKVVGFHPNENTSTLEITHENLEKFCNTLKHHIKIIKL